VPNIVKLAWRPAAGIILGALTATASTLFGLTTEPLEFVLAYILWAIVWYLVTLSLTCCYLLVLLPASL
jgi:hypothetical protein